MYFDGQNLEAQSEEDEDKIIEALKRMGELKVLEQEHSPTIVQVAQYSFIMQQGNWDFVTVSAADDESDEMLYRLFLDCGGQPEDIQ